MNIKKPFLVIVIIGGVVLIGLLYFFFMSFAAFGGLNFLIYVPKPAITYGEFPFRLEYELNGETKVIEDTIICEFDGFEVIGEAGKYRKWKSHLKSGNEQITLLDLRETEIVDDFKHHILELYFAWGNEEYYMGDDMGGRMRQAQNFIWIYYTYQNADGITSGSGYKADIAYEKYKIKLISWEVSPPIQNSFK